MAGALGEAESYLLKKDYVDIFSDLCPELIDEKNTDDIDYEEKTEYDNPLDYYGYCRIKKFININEVNRISLMVRDKVYVGNDVGIVMTKDNLNYIIFEKGRQDIWGFNFGLDMSRIEEVLNDVDDCDLSLSSSGVLTLDAGVTSYGKWHRDVMPLFGKKIDDSDGRDKALVRLPNFYFTIFVPLTDLNEHNGSTELMSYSHKLGRNEFYINDYREVSVLMDANAGDAIIMNGKVIHRARPNRSDKNRDMLYFIYCAEWYNESKFFSIFLLSYPSKHTNTIIRCI